MDDSQTKPKGKDPVTGQFVKGNTYTPIKRVGRRKDHYAILKAVAEDSFTPAQLTEMVRETYATSKEAGDWKGMLATIKLVMDYTVGKPVQRTLTATMDADELRAMFFAGDENATIELTLDEETDSSEEAYGG